MASVVPNRLKAKELPMTAVLGLRLSFRNWPVLRGRERTAFRSLEVAATVAEGMVVLELEMVA